MGAMNELYTELEEIKDRIALMVYKENKAEREELACDICDRISNMVTGFLASHTLYLVKEKSEENYNV